MSLKIEEHRVLGKASAQKIQRKTHGFLVVKRLDNGKHFVATFDDSINHIEASQLMGICGHIVVAAGTYQLANDGSVRGKVMDWQAPISHESEESFETPVGIRCYIRSWFTSNLLVE